MKSSPSASLLQASDKCESITHYFLLCVVTLNNPAQSNALVCPSLLDPVFSPLSSLAPSFYVYLAPFCVTESWTCTVLEL